MSEVKATTRPIITFYPTIQLQDNNKPSTSRRQRRRADTLPPPGPKVVYIPEIPQLIRKPTQPPCQDNRNLHPRKEHHNIPEYSKRSRRPSVRKRLQGHLHSRQNNSDVEDIRRDQLRVPLGKGVLWCPGAVVIPPFDVDVESDDPIHSVEAEVAVLVARMALIYDCSVCFAKFLEVDILGVLELLTFVCAGRVEPSGRACGA